ncbi:MAG: DUF4231 domain-containing protein [Acidimicrobiales bacterium]
MSRDGYREWLKNDFEELIELVDVADIQKRFLRSRWLDQVLWTEGKAPREQRRYHVLRVTAIAGGVLVPALVSLDIGGGEGDAVRWVTFALGLLVALAVSLEGFFRFGERWRHYRRTAELLKIEGWQFFESAGPYQGLDHRSAFPSFASRTEAIIQRDVDAFISVIATDKSNQTEGEDSK